jgi:hypothetical protein
LYAVWKGNPAEIILINFYITEGRLQQALVYPIAEDVVPADSLAMHRPDKGCR